MTNDDKTRVNRKGDRRGIDVGFKKGYIWITNGEVDYKIMPDDIHKYPGFFRGKIATSYKKPRVKEVPSKLYLVRGLVRMESNIPGRAAAQSEELRLVWALNVNEAYQKYQKYFTELSTRMEIYSVLNMAATEAIR
jgi:hypothetical protein